MKFLKKFDHLKMIQLALGISIFSIGYLVTMFYFQMHNLKEYKQLIVLYNNANVNILHLELEMERDTYFSQYQLLNHTILSQKTYADDAYIASFFEGNLNLKEVDAQVIESEYEIKNLIDRYQDTKKQLFKNNYNANIKTFNAAVIDLQKKITRYSDYLDSKINLYNDNYDQLISSSKNSGLLIALISFVLFMLSYAKMNEDLNELKKVNEDLLFSNETLNNAEMVAGFGSWKVNVLKNKYLFSDNFYRIIGLAPKEFDASLDNIMNYIHPDDREEVYKQHKESLITQENSTITYRCLLADGTIKHMVSVGKFIHNSKGELVKIGVNQDVTELIKKTKELEEKNNKLITINSELESFNNIVSHDLQEPLRKIQMFISRIESQEFLKTSTESTVGYFEKIKSASVRMQNLMSDLVDYTRTVKGDRVFEKVNLNSIFDEIKEDLILSIEENQAKIAIDNLPILLGTKFQIQQLFVNLISNALKYVRPGINPVITVKLESFTSETINNKLISGSDYYKITVNDNGIGFDQQYAEKIFMLFKRLQTDYNYKGTGLGLAICKKIVENHNGYITAIGKPNIGSVFSIYLPKKI